MSNERIDLTQFEGMVEDLGEPRLNQDKMPLGNEWLIPHIAHLQCGYGMESDDLEQIRITVLAMSKTPDLIAELKRCYDLIDKMQHSIVKNRGDCWDCDMPIDSCDARNCERQMLEDIEWRSASE